MREHYRKLFVYYTKLARDCRSRGQNVAADEAHDCSKFAYQLFAHQVSRDAKEAIARGDV